MSARAEKITQMTAPEGGAQHVYRAIADVMRKLTIEGIGKNRENAQQGFMFRGIDDVYNALAPLLSEYRLCVLPRVLSREVTERMSANNKALFYVTVCAEFDFVSAIDGSKHTVGPIYGEAMDSGDKATNKAMSAAFKYVMLESFCIPTEGDNDADATTHEVVAGVITEEQLEALEALIAEVNANKEAFLKVCKVERLEDLPAAKFDGAVKKLEAKRKQ